MAKMLITVQIVVEGNTNDIIDAVGDFAGAVSKHFNEEHYVLILCEQSTNTRELYT